jgi:hypothetical protein
VVEAVELSTEEKRTRNRAYQRTWRTAHPEAALEAHEAWYWSHHEQALAYQRAYGRHKRDSAHADDSGKGRDE